MPVVVALALSSSDLDATAGLGLRRLRAIRAAFSEVAADLV
jgi:hypothetical protein